VWVKLSELLSELNRLKLIPRTGWLFCNVPPSQVEDVAQHTFEVCTITMFLLDELERTGKKLDRERAISMAILHDWAEADVADFPYTARKYLGSPDIKHHMEHGAMQELLKGWPEKRKYLALWGEYADKRTPESRVVRSADYISILVQATKYRGRGIRSKELEELWRTVKKDLRPYLGEFEPVGRLLKELDLRF
jgi:putative hydrolase of HD superfamily